MNHLLVEIANSLAYEKQRIKTAEKPDPAPGEWALSAYRFLGLSLTSAVDKADLEIFRANLVITAARLLGAIQAIDGLIEKHAGTPIEGGVPNKGDL